MKSKEEVYRLLWTLSGAIGGVALGFGLMTMLFARVPTIAQSPTILPLLVVMLFCGGGLVGGGYLALTLLNRKQKVARKQYFEEKKKKRKKGKK